MVRCPLRPYKDSPQLFSDLFKLYSFREKNVMPEAGSYYDQPNVYIEAMVEMDSAISDRMSVEEEFKKRRIAPENNKVDELAAKGIIFKEKKSKSGR